MPGAARLGDKAQVAADAHGCPSCPHPGVGPITVGSPDVFVNKKPAARLDDIGVHAVCCGPNNFSIVKGSSTVYVNGKPLARLNDKTKHCGGTGPIIEGSPDVLIDDGAASAAAIAAMKMAAARKIALEQSKKNEKGTAKKASDNNPGSGAAGSGGGAAGAGSGAGAGGASGKTGAGKGAVVAKKGPAGTGKGGKSATASGDLGKDGTPKKVAAKPAGTKPADTKPADTKPADTKPETADKAAPAKPPAEKTGKEKSGAQWVARFPTSRSVDDLSDDFRPKVEKFLAALDKAGASVSIAATFRPVERAFLMHYSPMVADGSIAPDKVPAKTGVDIDWDHGDLAASKQAAQAMANGYDIAFPAALASRHTAHAAIDMDITWSGTLEIVDGNGKTVSIGAPRSGSANSTLHEVGASYGVNKLIKDKPHWSDNGH